MLVRTGAIDYGQPVNLAHPLSQGLVSWWRCLPLRMSGNRWLDLLGKNHADFNGSMAVASSTSGYAPTTRQGGEGEVRFDGTNDYANTGKHPIYSAWTMSFWIQSSSTNYRALAGREYTNSILQFGADSKLKTYYSGGTTGTSVSVVSTTVRQHWTVSWGGDSAFYLNGVHDNTTSATTNIFDVASQNIYLSAPSNYFYQGAMDDVFLFSRVLSAGEVSSLYLSSLRGHPGLLRRRSARYYSVPAAGGGASIAALAAANRHFLGVGVA